VNPRQEGKATFHQKRCVANQGVSSAQPKTKSSNRKKGDWVTGVGIGVMSGEEKRIERQKRKRVGKVTDWFTQTPKKHQMQDP